MSTRKKPNVLRYHARKITPLQTIEWRTDYPLSRLFREPEIAEKMGIKDLKKLYSYHLSLKGILIDISLIVLRINEDISKNNRSNELFEIVQDRPWTEEEESEVDNLSAAVNLLSLDIGHLMVHLVVFADTLARFLTILVDKRGARLRSSSFHRFKADLEKLEGKEINELFRLIHSGTKWFKEVQRMRDDFIIHHPGARGVLAFYGDEAYVSFTTTKDQYPVEKSKHIIMNAHAEEISIEEIDSIVSQLKQLLRTLTEYLCDRIDSLPIKVAQDSI